MRNRFGPRWYILDENHNAVPATDREWIEWTSADPEAKRVAYTDIEGAKMGVSTVFLGLDHNFSGERPMLFETMVFGKDMDGEMDILRRYSTWNEAVAGHDEVVVEVRRALIKIVGGK